MRVYSKVSRLAAWSENCKWYSSLPLGAVASQQAIPKINMYFITNSVQKLFDISLNKEVESVWTKRK